MTHLTETSRLPLGAISIHRAVAAVLGAVAELRDRYAVYRTVRALDALSDRQLDDVGLTRGDLNDLRRHGLV